MKNNKKTSLYDNRIFWVVVSLLASLIIWVYYTGTLEETITRDFENVEVVFVGTDALRESKGYVVTDVEANAVSFSVTGTRSNIVSLSKSDITAVIDLSSVTTIGRNMWAPTITFPSSVDAASLSITGLDPSTVAFYVSKTSKTTVEVKCAFIGSAAEGYILEELEYSPETITVSGPESELENIGYIWATLSGDDLTATKTADVPFSVVDKDGNELSYTDLEFDVDTVSITQPVSMKKEVPLTATIITGAGATREEYYTVSVEPATITISGDASIVEGINKIVVATIDLTDFESTFEDTYPIVLDNDVENVTGTTEATVTVEVIGLETAKFTVTNFSCTNVPAGYNYSILTKSLVVTVRATREVLDSIKADNIRAVADLTDVESTGDKSVAVKIYIDGFSSVSGAIGDYSITINISG